MNLIPMKMSLFLGFLSIETLKESDLTIGKNLGSGPFGEVFECYLSSNDTMKFAIKFSQSKEMAEVTYLIDCLANTNVVQFYGLVLVIGLC